MRFGRLMEPAIRVHEIGKRYLLGAERRGSNNLREALSTLFAGRFRRKTAGRSAASREFWALNDISFDVQPGEVLGIVGRNGAGKSTLLKILSQITAPTTGRIELNGRVASLLEVGTGFHPELSGRENIYLNGALLGMTRGEITRHFDEIVAFAEIGQFLDVPVKRYSSGMFVRLAFAVAAHLTSEILIIDEVLAVGDGGFQAKCLGKMRDVGASGRTVLFVSHDLAAVKALCNRALLLQNGRMVANAGVDEVVEMYMRSMVDGGAEPTVERSASDGVPELTEFALLDQVGNEAPFVEFRSSPTLRLRFSVPVECRELCFSVRLMSEDGRLKSTIASAASACPSLEKAGLYQVHVALPNFSCLPGRYFWSVQFWRPGERDPTSSCTGLFPFEVTPAVLNGASRPYLRWAGEFYMESEISLENFTSVPGLNAPETLQSCSEGDRP